MQQVAALIDSIVDEMTLGLRSVQQVHSRVQRSYETRSERVISSSELRNILVNPTWSENLLSAQRAEIVVPASGISELCARLEEDLRPYVEPSTGQIGHAFPIVGQEYGSSRTERDGIYSYEAVSSIDTFCRALVIGAATLGTSNMIEMMTSWLSGEPILYRLRTILNGGGLIDSPLMPMDGIIIESLPLSTDQLPCYTPTGRLPLEDYLGRMLVSVEYTASPALFRPGKGSKVESTPIPGRNLFDAATISQFISLVSGKYTAPAFSWSDYLDVGVLSLRQIDRTWSSARNHFRGSLFDFGAMRHNSTTGTVSLSPRNDALLDLSEDILQNALHAAANTLPNSIRMAVSRWSRSIDTSASLSDQYIDLRIALELLFLNDLSGKDRQELRFRQAIFGAWYLGENFEHRQRIFTKLRRAYDLASQAVHGGTVEFDSTNRELLRETRDLCQRALLKSVNDQRLPNWLPLVLGASMEQE